MVKIILQHFSTNKAGKIDRGHSNEVRSTNGTKCICLIMPPFLGIQPWASVPLGCASSLLPPKKINLTLKKKENMILKKARVVYFRMK